MGDSSDKIVHPVLNLVAKIVLGVIAAAGLVVGSIALAVSPEFQRVTATVEERQIDQASDSDEVVGKIIEVSTRPATGRSMRGRFLDLRLTVSAGVGKADYRPTSPGRKPSLALETVRCPNSPDQSARLYLFLYGEELGDNFGPTPDGDILLNGLFDVRDVRPSQDSAGRKFCFIDIHEAR